MANIKSAKKRILVNETKAARNKAIRSKVKTALHLDVAARHMKMQGKVFIHASMIHTFPCIFALL